MLNIVIFGPPGSGKGTQSAKLVDRYNLVHLSTGDIFRQNIKEGTDLGTLASAFMDRGELVPDDVTIKMLEAVVSRFPKAKGIIFDGFPRTVAQAEALDRYLGHKNSEVTLMLSLEVEDDELMKRMKHRAETEGRADDQDENVIKNRIGEYSYKTAPLKDYYYAHNKAQSINGMGSVDEIFTELCRAVDQNIPREERKPEPILPKKAAVKEVAVKKAEPAKKAPAKKAAVKKAVKKVAVKKVAVKKATKAKPVKKAVKKAAKKVGAKKAAVKKVKKKVVAKKPSAKKSAQAKPAKKAVKKSVEKKPEKKVSKSKPKKTSKPKPSKKVVKKNTKSKPKSKGKRR